MKIGILGAGFIGRAVARLAVQNGYEVMLSNSRNPLTLVSAMISIGCKIGTAKDASEFGDVVLLAVPFANLKDVAAAPLEGKIVMDACNYYAQRDGAIAELDTFATTTSQMVADHLAGAKIVKAFNAILEKDIEKDAKPVGSGPRRALPIAGDDPDAKRIVTEVLEKLGFDVVDAGPLAEGWRFERARPAYCVPLQTAALIEALQNAGRSVEEGSWRKA